MSGTERQFAELPASYAQRGLWLIDRIGEPSAAYIIATAVRVTGDLDLGAVRRAFEELVRRHESLRTVFAWNQGQLSQLIEEPGPLGEVPLDFAVLETTGREVTRRAVAEARTPFDLTRGPLLRVRVLRVTGSDHLLVAATHHIVSDGWSEGVLLRDFAAFYNAEVHGVVADLAEPPFQYADFAQWQRERLTGPAAARTVGFWERRLRGAGVLELPVDRPRPPVQAHRGAEHRFDIAPELAARLRALAVRERTTLFSVLYAAYHVLLARYTRTAAPSVGVPMSNRGLTGVDGLIGLFVNHAVFRLDTGDDPTFRELLERVRREFLDALEHIELPFSRLVEELQPDRDLSRNPVFQTVFSLEERPAGRVELSGARWESVDLHLGISKFDTALVLYEDEETLTGFLEYDVDLFDPAIIALMAGHYVRLLESAVDDPGARLSALEAVPDAERRLVVHEWNDTASPFPYEATTAELFEEQAAAAPDAPAVLHPGGALTYRELNERANRLAHHLRGLGVGPDAPVGVCLAPSPELLVAVVGILKAGGAYLPLPPTHPEGRLRHNVEDAGARVVVTTAAHAGVFAPATAHTVALDTDGPRIARQAATDPEPLGDAGNLAYVIYTSGSTGTPKGIGVAHRALARLVKGSDYAALRPGDVHLHLSPLSFDASLLEVWGALLNGGAVALPRVELPFPDVLRDALERYPITTMLLISPQLHVAADEFPERLSQVPQVLVGGDVLSPQHARKLLPHLPDTRFVHVYGPTECTLFATAQQIEDVDTTRPTVPIGRAIANTRAYVLDEHLRPAPVGVPGELWLGGDGLARGYVGRPGLTAERFRPDPYGPPGGRLYGTGDLVRWLPSGRIEFLGRIDGQVKVRGFRIETGEVAAVLTGHPAVREAVVTARDDLPGGRALVAHLVTDPAAGQVTDDDLRAGLRAALPEYMVPAAFVRLEAMPLTFNGKVNLAGLPAPDFDAPSGAPDEDGPRTPAEEKVRDAWRKVLGVEDIGRDTKFFEIGGNSLLLAELFNTVQDLFPGVDFSLVELFELTTYPQIAEVLADRSGPDGQGLTEAELDV